MKIGLSLLRRHSKQLLIVSGFVAFSMTVGSLADRVFANSPQENIESGQHVVSIHDRGQERVIVTKARTVRQALKAAEIQVNETGDVVEPGLDTELIASKYNINIYRARPVTIVDGLLRQRITTAEQTQDRIAKVAGVELFKEDRVEIGVAKELLIDGPSVVMTINRSTPVNFTLYGKNSEVRTQATTVGEFLKEKNIKLGANDMLSLAATEKIYPGIAIDLWREGKQTITQEEDVDFPVDKIQDANRDLGFREVKEAGEKGKRNATYEIEMRNGQEVSRKEVASVIIKEPKKQVEIVGAKHPPVAGPAEIIALINEYSAMHGLDANKVARIAKCESTFNPRATNGIYQGLFQHHAGYWPARAERYGEPGASIFDARAQVVVTTAMMAQVGYGPWECQ